MTGGKTRARNFVIPHSSFVIHLPAASAHK